MQTSFVKKNVQILCLVLILYVLNFPVCRCHVLFTQPVSGNDSLRIIEKVYLHTDRDYYSPGDDIWFKAYLVKVPDNKLSDHSRNLHVELISPGSAITDTRTIRIEQGLGNGDFRLSDSLQSGLYAIRAYTNYMRNFNDPQFFTKEIKIISSPDSGNLNTVRTGCLTNKTEIKFFPEGGSLINDITSVVAFKAVDANGSGCDVMGEVFASTGERVTSFRSSHNGMGKFSLRPVSGMKYYSIIMNSDGETIRCDIPESFSNGVVLNVSDQKSIMPLITIRTNPGTLPMLSDQELSLTISVRKVILKILTLKITSLFTSLRLPPEDLPDGIIQLTLSGPGDLPLCERLIYLSNNTASIELITDKPVYRKRDSVSVKINLSADPLLFDQAFLSLSAAENIYLKDDLSYCSTISSWFLLESDIRGPVEDPSYYFDQENRGRREALDLLLCTQGWRDFEWKYKNHEYLPENGFSISGRVQRLFSRDPLKNSSVTAILISDNNEFVVTSPADSSGIFRFEEFDFTGKARLILSVVGEKDKLQGHIILDSMVYIPAIVEEDESRKKLTADKSLIADDNHTILEQEYVIKNSIRKKYTLADTIMLGEVEILSRQKKETRVNYQTQRIAVGIPDIIIEMTPELENKTDFRTILRNRVAGLTFELTGDPEISGIRIRGSPLEPLFMMDGIVVPYGMVATLPLTWIERIEVLKSGGIATTMMPEREDDPMNYNGVISVITKPAEERKDDEIQVYHSVNKIISGYDTPRIFYSPDHSSGSDTGEKPDLRSTLFWEPNIIVSDNEDLFLKFFNADNAATVQIIIEGITSSGIPVTGRVDYLVE